MCRLVMGNKTLALQEMSQACALCQSHPKLLQSHKPQLHTLLGLYAMSMNCMEAAEAQFTAALKVIVCIFAQLYLHILIRGMLYYCRYLKFISCYMCTEPILNGTSKDQLLI